MLTLAERSGTAWARIAAIRLAEGEESPVEQFPDRLASFRCCRRKSSCGEPIAVVADEAVSRHRQLSSREITVGKAARGAENNNQCRRLRQTVAAHWRHLIVVLCRSGLRCSATSICLHFDVVVDEPVASRRPGSSKDAAAGRLRVAGTLADQVVNRLTQPGLKLVDR